jgi:hypothetical protein
VIAVPHLVTVLEDAQTKVIKSLTDLDIDQLREFYLGWF